jgi:hypothetical protein
MLINIKDIKGEAHTGYENGTVGGKDMGEFECENCHYYRASDTSCGQKEMVVHSKQPLKDGRRTVDPEGCCEFVERIGRKDDEKTNTFDIANATWLKRGNQ